MPARMSQTKSSFASQDFGGGLPLRSRPPNASSCQGTLRTASGGIEGRSLETGTLLPWPIRSLFSRVAGWLSVMWVQRVCDESVVRPRPSEAWTGHPSELRWTRCPGRSIISAGWRNIEANLGASVGEEWENIE